MKTRNKLLYVKFLCVKLLYCVCVCNVIVPLMVKDRESKMVGMYVCMTNATAVYAWDHSLWQKDQKALRRSWRVGSCCHAHETIV